MIEGEKQTIEYKSIQKIRTGDRGFRDLAVTCVSLANAQGGRIFVGYDDKGKCPLLGQVIDTDEVNDAVSKLRSLCFNVAVAASEVQTDNFGSQYFIITVYPSFRSIATTSDGKIYIRVADKCEPVRSEDIQRLSEEKGTYQWEMVRTKFMLDESTLDNLHRLAEEIRRSPRVAFHIKQLDDIELAEHYCLMDAGQLTHLGVLWLGTSKQRQTISYPITAQYIVYDNLERKVRKVEWHDNTLNPKELLLSVVLQNYKLTQKGYIAFGIIARERKILSTQLSAILQLSEEERLRSYTDKLVKDNIVCKEGVKKGSFFSINPQLIKNAKVNLVTTLKTLESHALKALIMEDLKLHPGSRISEIARRLPEADIKDLRKIIYPLVNKELRADGAKSERRYWFL